MGLLTAAAVTAAATGVATATMGIIQSSKGGPKQQALPKPPSQDAADMEARSKIRAKQKAASKTILSTPLGVSNIQEGVTQKTLLGG